MCSHMKRYAYYFLSFEFKVFEFVSDFEILHSDLNHKFFQIPPSGRLPEVSRSEVGGGASDGTEMMKRR